MILASHQPYFFPYIGYFSLISAVDKFIFFDTTQFNRKSWMTRNRILKPTLTDFQYINIGVRHTPFLAMLQECRLNPNKAWKTKLISQLEHYRRKALFYNETIQFLKQLLEIETDSLLEFNVLTTKEIARQLKIKTEIYQSSEIKSKVDKPDDKAFWGLIYCKLFGANAYINAPGGELLYPKDKYQQAGIKLGFIQHKLLPYPQKNENFIPGLSIIDVLMFNGFDKTSEMIHDYRIKWVNN